MTHRNTVAGGLLVALLLCAGLAQAQVAVQQTGPATRNDGACFVQNGIIQDCGFPPAANVPGTCIFRAIATGSSDLATTADCSLGWASGTTSAKTEFLYVCAASTKSYILKVTDQAGTASTYPITLTANGTNKLIWQGVQYASFILPFSGQEIAAQCDGSGNWVLN